MKIVRLIVLVRGAGICVVRCLRSRKVRAKGCAFCISFGRRTAQRSKAGSGVVSVCETWVSPTRATIFRTAAIIICSVDVNEPLDLNEPIPQDKTHLHFGAGQTEARIELPPGKHTLQLVLGDAKHYPFNPPLVSEKITIRIK